MALQEDIVAEGVTSFAPPPTASYRYVIKLKEDSEMSIWIEDRIPKKQWYKGNSVKVDSVSATNAIPDATVSDYIKCFQDALNSDLNTSSDTHRKLYKGDMAKTDYVSAANAIPDATVTDYLKCFQDTLDSDLNESSDVQRKLSAQTVGALRLELVVTIRVLRATWLAKYTFDLDPVSVERIDILESKLRDQQDELEKLRGEIRGGFSTLFVHSKASQKTENSTLKWEKITSTAIVATGLDGVVKVQRGGTYIIFVNVSSKPGINTPVHLLKNKSCVQVAYPGYASGYINSVSLNAVEQLEKNDELTVTCPSTMADTSYLSIARMGD
ncbi:tumor necrosis factor-like domain [Phytophthora cinnamomi]|uniref:tumor necrosis factor-like domain n=1 Tax=Phytophthora cinnamomi TaxID=4785 RepID=UPI00355A6B62|nr:tumor necrosis factor-like domain [Phytophthora cinnamomi]